MKYFSPASRPWTQPTNGLLSQGRWSLAVGEMPLILAATMNACAFPVVCMVLVNWRFREQAARSGNKN